MYVCHDCGKEFCVPMRDRAYIRDGDWQEWDCCPNCGSDDINEVD